MVWTALIDGSGLAQFFSILFDIGCLGSENRIIQKNWAILSYHYTIPVTFRSGYDFTSYDVNRASQANPIAA